MVRVNVLRDVFSHRDRFAPYTAASNNNVCPGKDHGHKQCLASSSEGMDWKFATCAVCMEPPHNAVLLLCSSHNKGCHPYMCDTSYLHSNCLNLFKMSYTESMSTDHLALPCHSSSACKKSDSLELPCPQCPLCRGQVKGWTVVEPVRKFLNNKKRSCIQDGCSFSGTYSELEKHLEEEHPLAGPHEVDPELEKRWTDFVLEREMQDVISAIRSSMPDAVILGDFVLDREEYYEMHHMCQECTDEGGGSSSGHAGDCCLVQGLFLLQDLLGIRHTISRPYPYAFPMFSLGLWSSPFFFGLLHSWRHSQFVYWGLTPLLLLIPVLKKL